MLKFCANISFLFSEVPLLDRFAASKAAGFPGIEILWPYETPAREFGAAARDAGSEVANFNAPKGGATDVGLGGVPGREAEFRAGVAAARAYAETVGCKRVNILMGLMPDGYDRAACVEVLARNLEHAASEFEKSGITCLTEAINNKDRPAYLLNTVDEASALVRRVGHANLKVEADIYHMGLMGEDIPASFRRNADVIGHVQFADVPGRAEPGTGALPFAEIFSTIEAIGYKDWLSAEYHPSTAADTLGWFGKYK